MAYHLCQKFQQSFLVLMLHPPPPGEDSASSIAAVSYFLYICQSPSRLFAYSVIINCCYANTDVSFNFMQVVASMDWPEITKYRGLVSAQPHRQEIIEDLFTVSKDPQKGHTVNGGMIR
jgi:hypothetical protein